MAPQVVPAIPASPPRYSLLQAATTIEDAERWQAGVEWAPESCAIGETVELACEGNAAIDFGVFGPARDWTPEALPFVVTAYDVCSTIGFQSRDYEGRARRMLESTQSFQVAREFWTGNVTGTDNRYLDSSDAFAITGSPVAIVEAIGLAEQYLADVGGGRRGMIHLTNQAFVTAYSERVIEQQGALYVTPVGTIVVADAGYPTGDGETQSIFVTGMVGVRLSPIEVIPGTFAEAVNRAAAMVREAAGTGTKFANTLAIEAERLALVQWDSCVHGVVELDLAAYNPSGS